MDLLLFGHVHAYERTNPVANYTADPTGCAPTYITIGEADFISSDVTASGRLHGLTSSHHLLSRLVLMGTDQHEVSE